MGARGCVWVFSCKLHVRAGLSAGLQPRRCLSAVSLVDGIRQMILHSIFVHTEIVFDRVIRHSRLTNEKLSLLDLHVATLIMKWLGIQARACYA